MTLGCRLRTLAVLAALCGTLSCGTHRPAALPGPEPGPDVLATGDSITWGFATSDPPRTSYPTLAGVQSVAMNGACLSVRCPGSFNALLWFADRVRALPHRPDTGVALYGINDIANWHASPEEVIAGYARLQSIAKGLGIRLVFATITPISQAMDDKVHAESARETVNDWIRDQDDYVDYERALAGADGWLRPAYDSGDGVHLTDAGAARLARVLDDWIRAGE